MLYIWIITAILPGLVILGFVIFAVYSKQKDKEFNNEMMKRLPDVEYTEIVSSSHGCHGSISVLNSDGEGGYGSYRSCLTTKFLVVYKSGYKQIINLRDGTPLFNEYVNLLKK